MYDNDWKQYVAFWLAIVPREYVRHLVRDGGPNSSPDNVELVHRTMTEEIRRWIEKGVTEEELARAKTSYSRERDMELVDDGELALEILRHVEIDRSLSFRSSLLATIGALSVDELNATLRRLLASAPFVEIEAGDLAAGP